MVSSLRERRRQMLRDEILEAAQSLIAERGYAAMSMDELAARVGVSKPTLYSQFSTKEALVAAMAIQVMERLFSVVDDDGATERSPMDRLIDLLRTGVQVQLDERVMAMQLWMPDIVHMLKGHQEHMNQICKIDAVVVDLVSQAISGGEIDPRFDQASIVRVFYALFMSPHIGYLSAIDAPSREHMPDTVIEIFRRGLAPDSRP
ncbi:TetR/AcrR family transcriptional regulator [Oscillochloris sp. ZM17-4]|uniref:TetR/AcrR family transcriptional regulator n=1 Tax=Oscillochloris sp. ZM17-4 TaxID=2866714 RepID=UPI001C7342FC|nr:TetR/AcrR family transcriptional regulator [Oscillochloris sp. ZM17-4]MBX0328216.1 TetR/AcrR family transcriptional regulator [Oscillochloris sp. ZM17-4]